MKGRGNVGKGGGRRNSRCGGSGRGLREMSSRCEGRRRGRRVKGAPRRRQVAELHRLPPRRGHPKGLIARRLTSHSPSPPDTSRGQRPNYTHFFSLLFYLSDPAAFLFSPSLSISLSLAQLRTNPRNTTVNRSRRVLYMPEIGSPSLRRATAASDASRAQGHSLGDAGGGSRCT